MVTHWFILHQMTKVTVKCKLKKVNTMEWKFEIFSSKLLKGLRAFHYFIFPTHFEAAVCTQDMFKWDNAWL